MNAFAQTAVVAGYPPTQWSSILIPCPIGPAQQAVDTLPLQDLPNFQKVKKAVLQMLNLNPKAYRRCLREIKFRTDYQPWIVTHRVKNMCWKWLQPSKQTAEEVAEDVCMEHYVALLPYKSK